ncbi:MAG TPA: hypothetical protein VHY34_00010 [Caulobacteraceae bacterium]|nr:hypothetical protein [Caulobacteraceae bacterium]
MSGKRGWLVAVVGGLLVLLIAALAAMLFEGRDKGPQAPPPASTGGLVVQTGKADEGKVDPKKSLRCFVNGKFEGIETLADCAQKNGVATDALDVGVDQTGALAAANGQSASLAPLPPPDSSAAPATAAPETPPAAAPAQQQIARAPVADCLRYAGSTWRGVGLAMPLSACVQALFSGRCEPAGQAAYGRWGTNAVRLVPHRVEMADDNRNFRTLVEQTDDSCVIPQF